KIKNPLILSNGCSILVLQFDVAGVVEVDGGCRRWRFIEASRSGGRESREIDLVRRSAGKRRSDSRHLVDGEAERSN
ncbi:hypothetical protein LINGRAHAP2_LOCUS25887, partial [Linum grandiflorum]